MDETYASLTGGEPSGDKGKVSAPEDQAALIERIKLGEVELFLQLIQPHEKPLRAVCHSILQNGADAEEVVQETLLKALRHLKQLRTCECFKSWLFQIAVNEARKQLRERRSYESMRVTPERTEADQKDFAPVNFAGWRDIPSLTLERQEFWGAVNRALRSLDGIYREVFVLRDMHHFSVSQTANILGVSEACVMTRLHRARLHMRQGLAAVSGRPIAGSSPAGGNGHR